ncbi:DUF6457 domain-containing protein [Dactylosporangium sp. NPDC005555]|uniref:DUF6457 domain-containing protein n=1 Tax=Dactylosporangium sp. NPDC005555 TaxID=3154889 RepID=UPI0033B6BAAB
MSEGTTEQDLRAWVVRACAELGLEPLEAGAQAAILDLARDVAHNVARPGAPVTAFLLGVAVGRGADLHETQARLVAMTENA